MNNAVSGMTSQQIEARMDEVQELIYAIKQDVYSGHAARGYTDRIEQLRQEWKALLRALFQARIQARIQARKGTT